MKRRFYKKVSIFVCVALLFCCLPFSVVKASSLQDDSKPIFGLTAADVVEKYNQLTDQQKDQVLSSLGNTSIFANSLFGNIFNSTFGVLDDAIVKIGDLFFQANGVVYKLGSSALSWVSRLIDKVFNNDLDDLNISQPVVDDLYKNTRSLSYEGGYYFINGHIPSKFNSSYLSYYHLVYPLPNSNLTYLHWEVNDGLMSFSGSTSLNLGSGTYTGLVVNKKNGYIYIGSVVYNFNGLVNTYSYDNIYPTTSEHVTFTYPSKYIQPYYNGSNWQNFDRILGGLILGSFNDNYLNSLFTALDQYFASIDYYLVINTDNSLELYSVPHSPEQINITNNTYYNYIYNIPDQTPLNVTNIVSNTAIYYDPVENLVKYLPDNYNIEQNFSVVNNYYISSGSAITTQGAIDVNLVSPSVIDVRITNPEDISNQVHNEVNKDIINNNNINFGDLNISVSVDDAVSQSSDILNDNIDTSEDSPLGFMVAGIPPDLLTIFGAFVVGCLVCALFERVFR